MKLWEGRFAAPTAADADAFNESLSFDKKLYRADITASLAHAEMLARCGIISEADVLGFFSGDRETAEANKIAMTQPYATVGRTLVRNKKVSYPSEHLTAAVVEGRPLPKEIEAENLVYYPSITEALKAVDRGEVDIACGISAQIELEIQRRHFANLVPVSLTDGNDQIRFAVNKPADTPLFTILNKVISMTRKKRRS
mgnify:CR=1 FL=1